MGRENSRKESNKGKKFQKFSKNPTSNELPIDVTKLTKQQKRDLKRNAKTTQPSAILKPNLESSSKVPSFSVYKRECILPFKLSPQFIERNPIPIDRFVNPTMDPEIFPAILNTCYQGFQVDPPAAFLPQFHDQFQNSLDGLDRDGMYQFDFTQPTGLGQKIVRTFVSRCVVGIPGITYKYLGLRMFAHPWDEGEVGATKDMVQLKEINQQLIHRSKTLLASLPNHHPTSSSSSTTSSTSSTSTPPSVGCRPHVGSCEYNITLINRCYPLPPSPSSPSPSFTSPMSHSHSYSKDSSSSSSSSSSLTSSSSVSSILPKEEPLFRSPSDFCSVSWHADSSLEHFSTIAVYHYEKTDEKTNEKTDEKTYQNVNNQQNKQEEKKEKLGKKSNKKSKQENKPQSITTSSPSSSSSSTTSSSTPSACLSSSSEWRVALRVLPHAEGPTQGQTWGREEEGEETEGDMIGEKEETTEENSSSSLSSSSSSSCSSRSWPPVSLSLPSGACYYMLDDFNHHHQHAVLSGSSHRLSSTHRVVRREGHTFEYIRNRLASAIQSPLSSCVQTLRSDLTLLIEVESEWMRQFYIQGSAHYLSHPWWVPRISLLLPGLWSRLEGRVLVALGRLRDCYRLKLGLPLIQESSPFSHLIQKSLQKQLEFELTKQQSKTNKQQQNQQKQQSQQTQRKDQKNTNQINNTLNPPLSLSIDSHPPPSSSSLLISSFSSPSLSFLSKKSLQKRQQRAHQLLSTLQPSSLSPLSSSSSFPSSSMHEEEDEEDDENEEEEEKEEEGMSRELEGKGKGKGGEGKRGNGNHKQLVIPFDALIQLIEERITKREGWRQRERESIFLSLPESHRPIPFSSPLYLSLNKSPSSSSPTTTSSSTSSSSSFEKKFDLSPSFPLSIPLSSLSDSSDPSLPSPSLSPSHLLHLLPPSYHFSCQEGWREIQRHLSSWKDGKVIEEEF